MKKECPSGKGYVKHIVNMKDLQHHTIWGHFPPPQAARAMSTCTLPSQGSEPRQKTKLWHVQEPLLATPLRQHKLNSPEYDHRFNFQVRVRPQAWQPLYAPPVFMIRTHSSRGPQALPEHASPAVHQYHVHKRCPRPT